VAGPYNHIYIDNSSDGCRRKGAQAAELYSRKPDGTATEYVLPGGAGSRTVILSFSEGNFRQSDDCPAIRCAVEFKKSRTRPGLSGNVYAEEETMRTIKIKGMSCKHCVMAVTKALSGIEGVKDVRVDLEKGEASFEEERPVDMETVRQKIVKAGYEIG